MKSTVNEAILKDAKKYLSIHYVIREQEAVFNSKIGLEKYYTLILRSGNGKTILYKKGEQELLNFAILKGYEIEENTKEETKEIKEKRNGRK